MCRLCPVAEQQASPYLTGVPQLNAQYSHYMSASPMLQVVSPGDGGVNSQLVAQAGGAGVAGYGAPANKLQRSDRIEVSGTRLNVDLCRIGRDGLNCVALIMRPHAAAQSAFEINQLLVSISILSI